VAQGMLHAGNGQMKIRDPALRAAVASCYIERNRIHLGRKIKEGNFGVVYDAKWIQSAERTRRVAAKTMKNIESQQQLENFLKEGVMMKGKGLDLFTEYECVYFQEAQTICFQ
jgi:serine/threonine protein kinase